MPYILKLQILNDDLIPLYQEQIDKNNLKNKNNPHPDSGFDVFFPQDVSFEIPSKDNPTPPRTLLVDLGIKCAAYEVHNFDQSQLDLLSPDLARPYYLHPRSSIYKTNFRLSNCAGIIDSGYRGQLKAPIDFHVFHYNNSKNDKLDSAAMTDLFTIKKGQRLLQICMPNLSPFKVYIVDKLDNTIRGEGGFGSTGK